MNLKPSRFAGLPMRRCEISGFLGGGGAWKVPGTIAGSCTKRLSMILQPGSNGSTGTLSPTQSGEACPGDWQVRAGLSIFGDRAEQTQAVDLGGQRDAGEGDFEQTRGAVKSPWATSPDRLLTEQP